MADTSQGKTLDDVYGILSKLAESQAAIAQSQASLAQSHASLAEGQAAIARSMSELVSVQKGTLEAQKETVYSVEEMLDLQKKANAANAPPPPTMDAGSRLTGTFELLEHILLHDCVAMETVLFAQRVNKCFNATIDNSKALQQKLFFAPLSSNAAQEAELLRVNPLFAKNSFLGRLTLYLEPSSGRLKFFDKDGRVCLSAQAPIVKDESHWSGFRVELSPHIYWGVANHTALRSPGFDSRPLTAGSWRRMYLSQPPRSVFFHVQTSTMFTFARYLAVCDRLCTMNELLDVLAAEVLTKL
ncbi:hypothetical protein LTR56_024549 [Elasticomyces elasticus]|nr:hypothetical protein LTR56_024549 [Elasticomyces elasticus]KAK3647409.1 hypothetical protein LTR22_013840 [Elasticomyces elasticus]KAK4917688.1 hypothetical protein LTR49_014510 [Elasticomyces elasticus]KAK5742729.1 hypothetical protein LTS12_024148 [Elasticomyces elasticus]